MPPSLSGRLALSAAIVVGCGTTPMDDKKPYASPVPGPYDPGGLVVVPPVLDFGAVEPGAERVLGLVIENRGERPARVDGVRVTPVWSGFHAAPWPHAALLKPGDQVEVSVAFVAIEHATARAALFVEPAVWAGRRPPPLHVSLLAGHPRDTSYRHSVIRQAP